MRLICRLFGNGIKPLPPPVRSYFQADDGTYYRTCPLIAAERDAAMRWPNTVPNKWDVVDALMGEWRDTYRQGVQRISADMISPDCLVIPEALFRFHESLTGLDKVQAAVRAARGGDPPPQIQGYA